MINHTNYLTIKQVYNNHEFPKKVAILYSDVKRDYFPTNEAYITEKDSHKNAEIIKNYLTKLGIETDLIPGNLKLPHVLYKSKPELVINLVDSVKGSEFLSSSIPGVLELLEIPYTGAGILGLSLCENKFLTKKIFQQNGIPTPHYQLANNHNDLIDPTLRYPLISKLNETHGAVEITNDAVSENEKHLRERLKFLISTYNQPVLIEEFIVGREVSAFLLEGLNKKVYLAERIINKQEGKYNFATFELQWLDEDNDTITYQKFDDRVLSEYVRKAFSVVDMADYGKFDVRIDSSGRYFFIDSNANPSFGPKETENPIATVLEMYGINFNEILKRLLLNTMRDAQGKERLPVPESFSSNAALKM